MHIHRISLQNTEFEGNNNAYLLGDTDPVLIDPGVATDATREQLAAGLADHDLEFRDVDRIFLTHWHADHAGLAGELQEISGAEVYAHEGDASLVAQGAAGWEAQVARHDPLYDAWGMPAAKRTELRTFFEEHRRVRGRPVDVTPVADGDAFVADGVAGTVAHLPGHTAGLAGLDFEVAEGRILFGGDVLLPKYTPNIGGADVRVEAPLATYLDTLRTLASRGYGRVYPGHRDPISAPAARAAEIVEHHRDRAERVLGVVREKQPVDAWTVSAELFGELEGIHVLHGPGEASAHLTHLARHAVLEATESGYVTAEDAEAKLANSLPSRTRP
nr:MBL fold metallo-hydrolase [Haladaptatus salinisoli]